MIKDFCVSISFLVLYLPHQARLVLLKKCWDVPGGPVAKNLPSNAGDVGLIPGWGTKIARTTGQLSPSATTREPTPLLLEKPTHATKTEHSQKVNYLIKKRHVISTPIGSNLGKAHLTANGDVNLK